MSSPKRAKLEPAPIFSVVVTGGPCGGKTSCFPRLTRCLEDKGYRVFTVTEAATLFFSSGVSFDDLDNDAVRLAFQQSVIEFQMNLEVRAALQPRILLSPAGAI